MIIGNGLIANLFRENDRADVVFFASGVSNSLETEKKAFQREEKLLKQTINAHQEKVFVYFSTCSIYDSSKNGSPYVNHKLRMERLVEEFCPQYLILRVSNAVGKGGNPNLLMNYLVNSVKRENTIQIYTLATRNLIDADDVRAITLQLIEGKAFQKIINVAYLHNFSTSEILDILEKHFQLKAQTAHYNSGQSYLISIPEVERYFIQHSLTEKEAYLKRILERYFGEGMR